MALVTVVAIIHRLLPDPHAGLLAGMVFGVTSALSADLHDALVRTGTIHIVALSGMNISILTNVVLNLLIKFMRRPYACMLCALITIGFISFVGPSASVVRAGCMNILVMGSVIAGRKTWPVYSFILAVIGMLLLNPLWLADPSFQLSVGATLGILLFANPVQSVPRIFDPTVEPVPLGIQLWKGFRSGILADLRVTMAAQVFTIPIILFTFQRISLIAPLSNVMIGFVIPPITVLGLIMVGIGLVVPVLAVPFAWIIWILVTYLLFVIDLSSRLPFASLGW